MKRTLKFFYALLLLTIVASSCKDSMREYSESKELRTRAYEATDFYWLNGEKIPLQRIDGKFYVMFYTANEEMLKAKLAQAGIELKDEVEVKERYLYSTDTTGYSVNVKKFTNYKKATVESSYEQLKAALSYTFHWAPYFRTVDGLEIWTENLFFVQLKPDTDLERLEQLAKENTVDIIGADRFLKGWYELACTNLSNGNAYEMAHLFYDSGLFTVTCTSFAGLGRLHCITEPRFTVGELWHLGNNMTYPNLHINYCGARSIIPQGSPNIKIAVIDGGVETTHMDFDYHVLSGWDAETGTSPNNYTYIPSAYNDHGTMVTGLIGSVPNNGLHLAGVAYGVTILPISFRTDLLGQLTSPSYVMRNAIDYAVNNGANVISCSWSYPDPMVEQAIINALNQGCVVVFSSGNSISGILPVTSIPSPANVDPRILVVGALGKNGMRWSNSCYSNALDIVAPGDSIFSTSTVMSSWRITSGTSFAAPQVAAVAALLLSISPDMRQQDVNYVIENTAQKLLPKSGYTGYTFSINKPNGTWNSEVGHGLLDAHAAVSALFTKRTINLGFHYHGGPVAAYCDNSLLSSGTSQNYQMTNYIGQSITQTVSVPSGYQIELEEEPRGDYAVTGENTSNLTVTYYLTSSGTTVNSLILKFSVK